MSKQEKIMEGVDEILYKLIGDDEGVISREILAYLHSQGVVIKADPVYPDSHYEAVEPLIKVGK